MNDKKAAAAIRKVAKGEDAVDKRVMLEIARLVESGKHKDAEKVYRNADTFVRDGIPGQVVAHITINASGGERVIIAKVRLKGTKKVFKEELGPGVIRLQELGFPKNISDDDLAMALVRTEEEILEDAVEVIFEEKK